MGDIEKLRWQCRRGALELDLMLNCYLDNCYSLADDEEKIQFSHILKWEDDKLLEVLLGGMESGSLRCDALIGKIRGSSSI